MVLSVSPWVMLGRCFVTCVIDDGPRLVAELLPPLERPIVLGLPRGGVPVAAEVALALGAPLDVIVVRKVGVPRQPRSRWARSARLGARVVDARTMRMAGASDADFARGRGGRARHPRRAGRDPARPAARRWTSPAAPR